MEKSQINAIIKFCKTSFAMNYEKMKAYAGWFVQDNTTYVTDGYRMYAFEDIDLPKDLCADQYVHNATIDRMNCQNTFESICKECKHTINLPKIKDIKDYMKTYKLCPYNLGDENQPHYFNPKYLIELIQATGGGGEFIIGDRWNSPLVYQDNEMKALLLPMRK